MLRRRRTTEGREEYDNLCLEKKSRWSGLRGEGPMKVESKIHQKYYLAGTVSPVSHVPVFLWPGLYFVSCLYYELSLLYIIFLLGRGYSNRTLLWIFSFDHKH